MLHKEFWGLLFLAFVGWIFVSANPSERIVRVCRPIGWSGNVVVSLSALVVPDQQKTVQGWFDKLEYGCQYTTWRLLYQTEWNAATKAAKQDSATAQSLGAAAAPAPAQSTSSATGVAK